MTTCIRISQRHRIIVEQGGWACTWCIWDSKVTAAFALVLVYQRPSSLLPSSSPLTYKWIIPESGPHLNRTFDIIRSCLSNTQDKDLGHVVLMASLQRFLIRLMEKTWQVRCHLHGRLHLPLYLSRWRFLWVIPLSFGCIKDYALDLDSGFGTFECVFDNCRWWVGTYYAHSTLSFWSSETLISFLRYQCEETENVLSFHG